MPFGFNMYINMPMITGRHRPVPASQSSFPARYGHADLFLQPEPFPRRLHTHLFENLGKVASAFLLNQHGGDKDTEILNRHPARQIQERGARSSMP